MTTKIIDMALKNALLKIEYELNQIIMYDEHLNSTSKALLKTARANIKRVRIG